MTRAGLKKVAAALTGAGAIPPRQEEGFTMLFEVVWDEAQRAACEPDPASGPASPPSPVDAPPTPTDPETAP